MEENYTLFEKLFRGETTEEENRVLVRMLEDGNCECFFEYCNEKWTCAESTMPEEVRDKVKSRIMDRLYVSGPARKRAPRFSVFLRLAACAVVLLVAVFAGWHIAQNRQAEIFKVVSDRGQKSTVTLPDGSRVWLNSSSSISYSSNYNTKERNVCLQGEAFFEVAKNPDLPFVVQAQEVTVTALGTRFNVRAYDEDSFIMTTLVEGSVSTQAGELVYVLEQAQEARFDKNSGTLTKNSVADVEHMIPWMKNEILFNDNTLAEIAVVIERMYNVHVIFADDDVKQYSYTGLIRNNSLQNVLELISGTSPVDYRMNTDTIKFYLRK